MNTEDLESMDLKRTVEDVVEEEEDGPAGEEKTVWDELGKLGATPEGKGTLEAFRGGKRHARITNGDRHDTAGEDR